ncbi:thioester-containing protein 1 allele S3-like [Wyeomyia smithii]|uniref:thioester-containing protein 1 allele S3-like n=1 Tax=Wyeomyia smithii TaxID=174621 RepID=UPI0024681CFE|nr:thioester-containing protein 1 allele S3-like [Wyeomyia smithii]
MKSRINILLVLLSFYSIDLANCTGNYVILAPNVFSPNSQYQFSISTFDFENAPNLQISLNGVSDHDEQLTIQQQVQLEPDQTRLIEFNTTNLQPGLYNVTIQSLPLPRYQHSINLQFVKNHLVLIHTDKPTYMPGHLVKFIVFVMDHQTKPLVDLQTIHVTLYDPDYNEIKVWPSAKLHNGVFQTELEIANAPNIGNWTLTVIVDDKSYSRVFLVEDYKLPNHEIRISSPESVTLRDDIKVNVDAWYTFGKPMKGEATINAECTRKASLTSKINGRVTVKFNVNDLLDPLSESSCDFIKIDVDVKEKHSRTTFNATSMLPVFDSPYKISMQKSSKYFVPGEIYTCWLVITDHFGEKLPSYLDHQIAVTVDFDGQSKSSSYRTNLKPNKEGVYLLHLRIPSEATVAGVNVIYETSEKLFTLGKDPVKRSQMFQVSILDRKPSLGKPVTIQVQVGSPLGSLVYQVSTEHKIVQTERIDPKGNTTVIFEVLVKPEMCPKATILVYTSQNEFILTGSVALEVHDLPNTIKLTTPEQQVKPGQSVAVTIETTPRSLVGLYAIDKRALLLNRDGLLTPQQVFDQLRSTEDYEGSYDNMVHNDMTLQTNGQRVIALAARFGSYNQDEEDFRIVPRNSFSESWLFDYISEVGVDGRLVVQEFVPDTITSWEIYGIALNPENGLAITKTPLVLNTFKPFFLMMNLPNSIKKNEIAVVEVSFFNYLTEIIYVGATLKNTRKEFEFSENNSWKSASYQAMNMVVTPNSAKTIKFYIKPKKMGNILVKVIADSTEGSDSIARTLLITSESTIHQNVIKRFIQIENSTQEFKNINMTIPRHLDAGSEKIMFSVRANLLNLDIADVDNYIRQPSGNAEQNIIQMVPSAILLDYITDIHAYNEIARKKTTRYLEMGYQNQLKFKRNDGSFSTAGNKDNFGSVFLTALVAKTLQQASRFVTVDRKVIDTAYDWLQKQQNSDGSFGELSPEQDTQLQVVHSNKTALTAYVLIAFMESKLIAGKYKAMVDKGVKYLPTNYHEFVSSYELSLVTYALTLANHNSKQTAIDELLKTTIKNDDQSYRWWESGKMSTETTAYALLSLFHVTSLPDLEPIFNWLASKLQTTETTFVGLQAMAECGKKMSPSKNSYEVTVKYGPKQNTTIKINPLTSLTTQQLSLPNNVRSINVNVTGTGVGIFELEYSYFSNILFMRPRFKVSVETLNSTNQVYLDLNICAQFLPSQAYEESGVVLMEITFPSGYIALDDSVDELRTLKKIGRVETRHKESTLLLYFESFPVESQCLEVTGFRENDVLQQVAGTVRIFDYFDNSRTAIAYFDGK